MYGQLPHLGSKQQVSSLCGPPSVAGLLFTDGLTPVGNYFVLRRYSAFSVLLRAGSGSFLEVASVVTDDSVIVVTVIGLFDCFPYQKV